jgi:hypothetical protein
MKLSLNKKSPIFLTFSRHFLSIVFAALTSLAWGKTYSPSPNTTTFKSQVTINREIAGSIKATLTNTLYYTYTSNGVITIVPSGTNTLTTIPSNTFNNINF